MNYRLLLNAYNNVIFVVSYVLDNTSADIIIINTLYKMPWYSLECICLITKVNSYQVQISYNVKLPPLLLTNPIRVAPDITITITGHNIPLTT